MVLPTCHNKEADIQIRQDRFNESLHKITVLTSHTSDWVQEISLPKHCGPLSLGDLLSSTLCQSLPFLAPSTFPSAPNSGADSHKIYVSFHANQLLVRFSQWEQVAWHLKGGKWWEAWYSWISLSASGYIFGSKLTSTATTPKRNVHCGSFFLDSSGLWWCFSLYFVIRWEK